MSLEKAFVFHKVPKDSQYGDPLFSGADMGLWAQIWLEQEITKAAKVPHFTVDRGGRIFTTQCEHIQSLNGYLYLKRGNFGEGDLAGGTPFLSSSDEEKVWRWPEVVTEKYTGRKVGIVSKEELVNGNNIWSGKIQWDLLSSYEKDGRVFIKPMRKIENHLYSVFTVGEDKQFQNYFWKHFETIEAFIISQPVQFDQEEREGVGFLSGGTTGFEYRAYVADRKLLNIAKRPAYVMHDVPKEYSDFANDFVDSHRDALPWGYVVDLTGLEGRVVVQELNPFTCSGRHPGNSFVDILNAFVPEHDAQSLANALPALQKEYDKRMRWANSNPYFVM